MFGVFSSSLGVKVLHSIGAEFMESENICFYKRMA